MVVGLHSVKVYADRAAAAWVALGANAFFDTDATGWQQGPFGPAITWGSGRVNLNTGGQDLVRTEASVPARPSTAITYRIRVRFSTTMPTDMWCRINFGKTAHAASVGPFWDPADAIEGGLQMAAVASGNHVLEFTWDMSVAAIYTWVSPVVSFLNLSSSRVVLIDSVEMHYRTASTSEDISCLVDDVSIQHGRTGTTGQPNAPAATINMTATPDEPLPAMLDVGAVVVVNTHLGGTDYARFTGRVTDMAMGWDDAAELTPESGVVQVVAVGILADLARRVVGTATMPLELDGPRVGRVLDLAGFPVEPAWADPGTVEVLARAIDPGAALGIAHGAADSAGGIVWQSRTGDIRYADAEHRRGTAVGVTLDACDILVTPTWARNLEGLVNAVSVGYGAASPQPVYTAEDTASINIWGRYAYAYTSELSTLGAASAMGQLLLIRNSSPAWVMSSLPVDVAALDEARTAQLLALDMHSLTRLTGLPVIGTSPGNVLLWVEGWRERLEYGKHEITLSVSGYCRSSPPPRWDDVDPVWTWNTVTPSDLEWDDTTCMGPPTDTGLWAHIPASIRWDDLEPLSTQWDQWLSTPI